MAETLTQLRKRASAEWPGKMTRGMVRAYALDMLLESLAAGRLLWPTEALAMAENDRRNKPGGEVKVNTGKGGIPAGTVEIAGRAHKQYLCPTCKARTYWTNDAGNFTLRNIDATLHACAKVDDRPNVPIVAPVTQAPASNAPAGAAGAVASALEALLAATTGKLDPEAVRAIVKEEIAKAMLPQVHEHRLSIGDMPLIDVSNEHSSFGYLFVVVSARIPLMLIGPAGSGKTTACSNAADKLGLPFGMISCGPLPQDGKLLGYMDATGNYVGTSLRECFEKGGVFLFDEMDAAHPGTLVTLNAIIDNKAVTWPDGVTVQRHKDFIPVAACNTFGTGADRQYVGRNQLDAATLDRFFCLVWDYDLSFTRSLLGLPATRKMAALGKSGYTVASWVDHCEKVMQAIARHAIRHVVGPRAMLRGSKLVDALPRAILEEGLLWKGLKSDLRQQIAGGM